MGVCFKRGMSILSEPHGVQGQVLPVSVWEGAGRVGRHIVTSSSGLFLATAKNSTRTNRETLKRVIFWA